METLPVIQAALQGCAANVGPLIGVDLELGEVATETTSSIPEGELAVQPLAARVDEEDYGAVTLSVPIKELATLGRRMVGDDEPDKERSLSEDDLDACGELLNLMGGAVDEAFREGLSKTLHLKPLTWWRTGSSESEAFAEGEHVVGVTTVNVPGGTAVHLTLRFPSQLIERVEGAESSVVRGQVLLAGLSEELVNSLKPVLEAARINVDTTDPEAEEALLKYREAEVILLSGDREGSLEILRRLRKSNSTWQIPSILCLKQPTREGVIRAMECGATHVLKVPPSEIDLLRILRMAQH